jgi:hypothetical protein
MDGLLADDFEFENHFQLRKFYAAPESGSTRNITPDCDGAHNGAASNPAGAGGS